MLKTMRDSSRWLMWIIIVAIGAVFVLYLGVGGGFRGASGPDVVVDVDGRRYTARDVFRVRERLEAEYRRTLGAGFDASQAGEILDEAAASSLMRMALLAREAEQMGLCVSDEEVRGYLKRISGAVDESGRLDQRVITDYAEREFGSVRRFQEALRDELLIQKVGRLLTESVVVSEAEARQAMHHQRQEVKIAWVLLDGAEAAEEAEVSEAEVAALLTSDPERLRATYDERVLEYDRPEQVSARHILIRLAEDADAETEAEARERIDAIAKRIEEGADFAEVAREASEGPSSEEGGDLGFFPRGRMVKPFEEVAFSLEPGTTSEVIRTSHGLHVIRVEERRAAIVVPFEEVQEEIARELIGREKGVELARERAEELAAKIQEGHSLLEVAREVGLNIERTDAFRHTPQGYVQGLGAVPRLVTAAFALSEEQPSSAEIFPLKGYGFVLIELLERIEPDAEEIETLLEGERERLLTERRTQFEQAWVTASRDALAENGKLFYSLKPLER